MHALSSTTLVIIVSGVVAATACDPPNDDAVVDAPRVLPEVVEGECVTEDGGATVEFLVSVGCTRDFEALASEPLTSTVPGARSTKVVLDRSDDDALYFQNSILYPVHYDFASTHLSGGEHPIVVPISEFNTTEYFSNDRRFFLGAVTHYAGPDLWALEIAPYDTMSAEMLATLYRAVQKKTFFGPALVFHPTSENVARIVPDLPDDVWVVETDELFEGTDYQPLSLGTAIGRLRFMNVIDLAEQYVSPETILVLDEAPNDLSVVMGLISQEFQTPLSHVNVLALNRGTPNMGLRGAMDNDELLDLEGKLVELTVGADAYSVREVTETEAEAFWIDHQPAQVVLPPLDLTVTALADIEDVTPEPAAGESLRDAIRAAVAAYGGKAANYSVLARTDDVPIKKAFAVPIFYYAQFMRDNGFTALVNEFLADESFNTDDAVRDAALEELRAEMLVAPIDSIFQDALRAKIEAEYPGQKVRFRTSTNSEDLDGFPCAGCYESHTGDPADWDDVLEAIRQTWATTWLFRTFEERRFYSVDHHSVGMALLVHANFPDEEANGVAVTANPFDESGLDPAFYVNVQIGGSAEVVAPPPGVTSDQFLYYFFQPGQPITYLSRSNLIGTGRSVLTSTQVHELGVALEAIQRRFSPAYGPAAGNNGWYGMDVEFKFDDEGAPGEPHLYIKQARPYPGIGQ